MYYFPQSNDYLFKNPGSPSSRALNIQLPRMESPYDLNRWNNASPFDIPQNSPKSNLLKPLPQESSRLVIPHLPLHRQTSLKDIQGRGSPVNSLGELSMNSARMFSNPLEPLTPKSSSSINSTYSPVINNSPYFSPNTYPKNKPSVRLPSLNNVDGTLPELKSFQLRKKNSPELLLKDKLTQRNTLVDSMVGLMRDQNESRSRTKMLEEKIAMEQYMAANLKLELARNESIERYNEKKRQAKKPKRDSKKLKEVSDMLIMNIMSQVLTEKAPAKPKKPLATQSLRNIEEDSHSEDEINLDKSISGLSMITNLSRD